VSTARQRSYGFSKWWNSLPPSKNKNKAKVYAVWMEGVQAGLRIQKLKKPKSNPKLKTGKRKIPAAFAAQARKAKAMTPAQRAAWAAKMQLARKRAALANKR
jgi:hypothetical protein